MKPKHISDIVLNWTLSLSIAKKKDLLTTFIIFDNWEWIVGSDYCKISFPYKILGDGNCVFLLIYVEREFASNIIYMNEEIVKNINGYFGEKVIDKVKFINFGA